jgi:hypothetical protein
MDVRVDGDRVELVLTADEAQRICGAIETGFIGVSRAEYYIRTGLSKPAMEEMVHAVSAAVDEDTASLSVGVEPGVELLDNPPRPRPSR